MPGYIWLECYCCGKRQKVSYLLLACEQQIKAITCSCCNMPLFKAKDDADTSTRV